MEPCIVVKPWEVDGRLAEMDLTREQLLTAARRGVLACVSCTPNHPPSFPSLSLWAEAMCGLGDETAVDGFRRVNEGGQPLLMHPSKDLAFTVATGDSGTGMENRKPSTKSGKGPRTEEAVRMNVSSPGWLFPELKEDEDAAFEERSRIKSAARNTWFLLICIDVENRVFRCELSLPSHLNDKNQIDDWSQRIILGEFPFNDGVGINFGGDPPMTDEIMVEIKRRA